MIKKRKKLNFGDRESEVKDFILSILKSGVDSPSAIADALMDKYRDITDQKEVWRNYVRTILGRKGQPVDYKPKHEKFTDAVSMMQSEDFRIAKKRISVSSKYYIVTWAQNNTPVFLPLWNNILAKAKKLNAQIHVIAGRYKNPTSIFSDKKEEHWDAVLRPYLDANDHVIHKYVSIMGSIKIQPTAHNPLTGMEGLSNGRTSVFGHPRKHLKTMPAFHNFSCTSLRPQFMFTTGAVTVPNYTDSAAGAKGAFHHTYGFVIIEVADEETFYIRSVTGCKDGSFTDLTSQYKDGVEHEVVGTKGCVFGDVHTEKLTPESLSRMIRTVSIFKPAVSVMHDIFDGEGINHHELDNPITQYLWKSKNKTLKNSVEKTITFLDIMRKITDVVVVNSNHDYFLERYISKQDWRKDPINAIEYMEYATILMQEKAPNGILAYIIDSQGWDNVKCLSVDESFIVGNHECGQHGHLGVSGSKGTPTTLRRMSLKHITGHTHSPLMLDGLAVVGVQEINQGYNKGASNHWFCDVIVHNDNKLQHILYFNNKFTTLL